MSFPASVPVTDQTARPLTQKMMGSTASTGDLLFVYPVNFCKLNTVQSGWSAQRLTFEKGSLRGGGASALETYLGRRLNSGCLLFS